MGHIVTLKWEADGQYDTNFNQPFLRRWDQSDTGSNIIEPFGDILITEGDWIELEDGIQIQFVSPENGQENKYRTGDYWLISCQD